MLHLILCHGRIMPRLAELLFKLILFFLKMSPVDLYLETFSNRADFCHS